MNKKQRKKKIGYWAFIKHVGDGAIYPTCQKCSFAQRDSYDINVGTLGVTLNFNKLYKFCPKCGSKMKLYDGLNAYIFDFNGEFIKKKQLTKYNGDIERFL